MKKLICIALLTALFLTVCTAALAATASYNDGRITVTTDSDGFFEIWVDGEGSGYWVGTGRPSSTFAQKLEDGQHTVRLYSPDGDPSESVTFMVGDMPAPTETPAPAVTEEPLPEVTEEPAVEVTDEPTEEPTEAPVEEHVHIFPVVEEEIVEVEDVVLVEPTCTTSGETAQGIYLPALGHLYGVQSKNLYEVRYACVRCGKTLRKDVDAKVDNRLGNIVKNSNMLTAAYQGYSDRKTPNTYFIRVKGEGDMMSLSLENQVIVQLFREGYQYIAFVNDNLNLTVALNSISKNWFPEGTNVAAYVLKTADLGVGSQVVFIYARVGEHEIPAVQFTGVTLNGAEITENGVY